MTSFRELLHDVAGQAQPIDDLADRALRPQRPSRPMIAFAAAVSVALVLSLTVFGGRLLDGGNETTTTNSASTTVRSPDPAPPLPDHGVDRALLTYRLSCKGVDGSQRDCGSWRVMTAGGKHYEVEGPADPRNSFGPGLLLSPDGDRIAYLRKDGTFVLRVLATGETTALFGWEPDAVYADMSSYAWSADGRWILAVPGEEACPPAAGGGCRMAYLDAASILVDTETGQLLPLGDGSGDAYGLPASDRPFPFDGVEAAGDGLPLVDYDGDVVGQVPNRLMPGQRVDGKLANISPDGSTLSVITFPKDKASDIDGGRPLVTVVDVDDERIVESYRIERSWRVWDSPNFVGWLDDSTVLIQTSYLKGYIPLGPGDSSPVNVDAFDVQTGKLRRVLHFPDLPGGLHIAYNRL
jgi:hypothetical protein